MTTVLDNPSALVTTPRNLRWWALGALALAVVAVGVDGTVLSVALPTLSKALHASESDLQWFSSGYFLVLAAAMLPAGLLGDRYGRKKVLLVSLALFGVGSVGCAYSTSVAEFMAARVLVGLAGAGLIVMAFSVLTVMFTKAERPKAVGIMSAATFLAFPIGPILGGWLLTNYWWGWVFLINVPVVVVGLAAVVALVPESRAAQRPSLDLVGVAASAAGLVVVTYGLIKAGQDGLGRPRRPGPDGRRCGAVGRVLRLGTPFDPPARRPAVDRPQLCSPLPRSPGAWSWPWCRSWPCSGSCSPCPSTSRACSAPLPWDRAYVCCPWSPGSSSGPSLRPGSCAWWGPRWPLPPASSCWRPGCSSDPLTSVGSSGLFVAVWMVVAGIGTGIAMATAMSAALVELSEEKSGVGSAVLQAVNKTGGPFGIAVLGSVLSAGYLARLDLVGSAGGRGGGCAPERFRWRGGGPQAPLARAAHARSRAFVHGMDMALLVSAGIALAGVVLTVVFLPKTNESKKPLTPGMETEGEGVDDRSVTTGKAA